MAQHDNSGSIGLERKAMPRCDGCKFWSADDNDQKRAGSLVVKRCTKALQWWDSTEWTDEPDPDSEWDNLRRVIPEAEGTKMFTQDGSDYHAYLLTAADFYCAHFEQPAAAAD